MQLRKPTIFLKLVADELVSVALERGESFLKVSTPLKIACRMGEALSQRRPGKSCHQGKIAARVSADTRALHAFSSVVAP